VQAGVPSDTATIIARSILLAATDPRLGRLVAPGEEEASRRMLGARATGGWFGAVIRRDWCRRGLLAGERHLLGGIIAHYLARKRWIEREVRAALAAGIRQVVVAGAGYDTLAWRLHDEFPDLRWFEIDHPATQAPKREALGRRPNLHWLPADLSRELPAERLASCPDFLTELPAFVIAEGLTMYFERDRVIALLRSLGSLASRGGRLLFTFMAVADDGAIRFRGQHPAVGWWLRLRHEPFRWGCRRADLPEFAAGCGLRLLAVADHRALRAEILAPRGAGELALASGECLALCTSDRS
jgi:methyltransferase (TIGR00027 family)